MKFLILDSTSVYYNLAVEQYLFEKTQDDVFILWQNEPTVVIGKNQNVKAELDFDYVREHGINIARRITGGGAVYHDLGNLNYSFISTSGREGIDFAYFTKPIIDVLTALGVTAELTGRNDIEVEGKKISGNAQCTKNGRTLHHGTLLFDTDLSVLSKVLHVDEEKIKSKAIKSVRARVANLKSLIPINTMEEFINTISSSVILKYSPEIISAPKDSYIDELEARNRSEEWLYPKNSYLSSCIINRKKKYDFGLVEAEISMSGEVISNIKIYGDFFGKLDISELETKIKGMTFAEISSIQCLNISDYIAGMNENTFKSFLTKD